MKTIFEINSYNIGSTGGIMMRIAKQARTHGYRVVTCCPGTKTNRQKNFPDTYYIGNRFGHLFHELFAKYTGLAGFCSQLVTLRLISKIKREKCDLIHIHNIHGNYINYPVFFSFIKRKKIPIVWTLHDCWSFTGRCPYFDMVNCNKWEFGCSKCPYPKNSYPSTRIDCTSVMWRKKKKWFNGIGRCVLVTPSLWLAEKVQKSYLKEYPVRVVNNGIDLDVFKPIESDFRKRYNLENKKIVLGVAFEWETRKGLDVFIELSEKLPADYQIVLVGTDDTVDKIIPSNILSIHRTQNQQELAQIYTAADVFVNPTREEVLGLVNIESLACGTPVVTFKSGGSPECVDETCGSVVDCNDVEGMRLEICRICEENPYSHEACLAYSQKFDENKKNEEYVAIYDELLENLK